MSFRRKFVRTLWTTAAGLPVLILFQLVGLLSRPLRQLGVPDPEAVGWVLVGLCGVTAVAQAAYTYCRWRLEVRAEPLSWPTDLNENELPGSS